MLPRLNIKRSCGAIYLTEEGVNYEIGTMVMVSTLRKVLPGEGFTL